MYSQRNSVETNRENIVPGNLCITWKPSEAWSLKKDLVTFLGLFKFLKLKKNSITALRLLKFLILKKGLHHFLTTFKVINAKKGLHHFLVNLRDFNTEKGLGHFLTTLKVFNIEKGHHHDLSTHQWGFYLLFLLLCASFCPNLIFFYCLLFTFLFSRKSTTCFGDREVGTENKLLVLAW